MNIVQGYPPGYDLIKLILNPPDSAIFCYGETIYSSTGREIPEDIEYHESVHASRQGKDPQTWWNRYLDNPDFRYEEELIAYAHQYIFIKRHYPQKAHKEALTELGHNLQSIYKLNLSQGEAESKIRNKVKELSI